MCAPELCRASAPDRAEEEDVTRRNVTIWDADTNIETGKDGYLCRAAGTDISRNYNKLHRKSHTHRVIMGTDGRDMDRDMDMDRIKGSFSLYISITLSYVYCDNKYNINL